jgi:hypothetical protein
MDAGAGAGESDAVGEAAGESDPVGEAAGDVDRGELSAAAAATGVGWDEVRRLALSFPDATEHVSWGSAHWRVHGKGFVWERPLRKTDLEHLGIAEQDGPVLGARVEDEAVKFALVESDPDVFFTTPHFDGWSAILVRLDRISRRRLDEVVADAFLAVAPRKLANDWLLRNSD